MGSLTGDQSLPLSNVPMDSRPSDLVDTFPDFAEIRKLDAHSYEYDQNADLWAALALLYVGGWELRLKAANFLWQRHKEPQDVYQSRMTRFNYNNILETVIGWYTSYLFRREPEVDILDKINRRPLVDTTVTQAKGIKQVKPGDLKFGEAPDSKPTGDRTPEGRDIGSPGNSEEAPAINTANDEAGKFYTQFRNNVDRAKTSLSSFFSKMMTNLLLNGKVFVLTDVEPITDGVVSRLQAENLGANKPYLLMFNSSDVINYRTDKEGNLVWAVVRSGRVDQETPFDNVRTIDQWWIYNQTSWALYEYERPVYPNGPTAISSSSTSYEGGGTHPPVKNARLVSYGLHALHHVGRCPLRMFNVPEGIWLGKRAYLPALSHLNEDNALQWLLAQTNLAIPVITGAGTEPGTDGSQTGGIRYFSEIYAINLPTGAKFEWSSPSGAAAGISLQRIESLREELYRLMYLQDQGRSAATISSQRSGAAIMLEKLPGREVAEALGRFIRDMMEKTYQDVIDARRETQSVEVSIRGFSFLENYVGLDLDDAERLKAVGIPSGTLMRYVFKSIARLYMQDAPNHLLDLAIAEIDQQLTDTTVLEFAQSTFQPIMVTDEGKNLKPQPISARVSLVEAQGG